MAIFAQDLLAGTDGQQLTARAADVGGTYTRAFLESNGAALYTDGAGRAMLVSGGAERAGVYVIAAAPASPDYAAGFVLTLSATDNAVVGKIGVLYRFQNGAATSDRKGYAVLYDAEVGLAGIYLMTYGPTPVLIGDGYSVALSAVGGTLAIRAECEGTEHRLYVDDVLVETVADATYAGATTATNKIGAVGISTKSGTGTLRLTSWYADDELTVDEPIVADRIAITTQPDAAVDVGDTITVVAAAQDADGNTQADYTTGTWKLRARTAPVGWDLSTVLDSDTPSGGSAAFSWNPPMAGVWELGVDDDDDDLADSADSDAVTATLPSGGATSTGGALADMDLLKGGSAERRTLLYQAVGDDGDPKTDLTGKPSISINGGSPSTTPAAADASHVGGGVYAVQLSDASLTAGDYVVVTAHGDARITPAVGRVVAVDVATAPLSGGEMADAVLGRNIAGSADGGHTVSRAMKKVVNKKVLASGTLTVYEEDGTTPAFTEAITGKSTVTGSAPDAG